MKENIHVDGQHSHISQEMASVMTLFARVPTYLSSHSSPSSPERRRTQCLSLYLLQHQYLASHFIKVFGFELCTLVMVLLSGLTYPQTLLELFHAC